MARLESQSFDRVTVDRAQELRRRAVEYPSPDRAPRRCAEREVGRAAAALHLTS